MRALQFIQHPVFRYLFAGIWLVNGLWCKVLDMVPRHAEIIGTFLGGVLVRPFTVAIGVAEIGMAVWILSGWRHRLCAALQISVILLMNILEFFAVPHLLLWGRLNIVFAAVLCVFIYANAFAPGHRSHA